MPPGAPKGSYLRWDDCGVWMQAQLIAYAQTKAHDENDIPPTDKSDRVRPRRVPRRRRR